MSEVKEVELRAGLLEGGVRHTLAVLREMTVSDVLESRQPIHQGALLVNPTEDVIVLRQLAARVLRIGSIEKPGEIKLKLLAYDDFGRLELAAAEMDQALAGWLSETDKAEAAKRGR
ncbi:hypothetical protein [Ferrovibrio sp.]|uniref:hypothetical protein n=1 Tax=Ferrovibrio sp. TaxID=1917215 RepID=UPI0035B016F2